MGLPDGFGWTDRTMRCIFYWSLCIWICFGIFFVIYLILDLMGDGSQSDNDMELLSSSDAFKMPDIGIILTWGYNGQGVRVNTSKLYSGHQEEFKNGYTKYRLNKYLSDRISMRRPLPDVRHDDCKVERLGSRSLPSASVVVVFRNEPRTVLLRMLYSVIDRSPKEQLNDIVLVDNGSENEDLKYPRLENYLTGLTKIRIIRLTEYQTIGHARMLGAQKATGEVLVFLQARCECTEGWMTPLVDCVAADSNAIAVPLVDSIDHDTFQYNNGGLTNLKLGSFSWILTIKKKPITKPIENATQKIPNSVIGDGIFAVNRNNFLNLGGFDNSLKTEASVDIEFSFRSWMCGLQIFLLPCSHVGFMSLVDAAEESQIVASETVKDNLKIADIWMDEYRHFVYERMQIINQRLGHQMLKIPSKTHRLSQLYDKCHNFDWYLRTVEPGMLFAREIIRRGLIFLLGAKKRFLRLGVQDENAVLQELSSSPVTFWYHLKSGNLVTENMACLSYEPIIVKTETTVTHHISPIESPEVNLMIDPEQDSIDSNMQFNVKNTNEEQNQNNLDSKLYFKNSDKLKTTFTNQVYIMQKRKLNKYQKQNTEIRSKRSLTSSSMVVDSSNVKGSQAIDNSMAINSNTHKNLQQSRSSLNEIASRINDDYTAMEPTLDNIDIKTDVQPGNTDNVETLPTSIIIMKSCENNIEADQWIYTKNQALQHVGSGLCMEAYEDTFGNFLLNLVKCNSSSWNQQWTFTPT